MAKWKVSFIVDGPKFEPLLETLHPFKVQDLDFQIVAGSPTKIRAGDKPAWEIAAAMATATPQPVKYFIEPLVKSGFKKASVYGAIDTAVKNGVLKKTSKGGVLHYAKK